MTIAFKEIENTAFTFRIIFLPPIYAAIGVLRKFSIGQFFVDSMYQKLLSLNKSLDQAKESVMDLSYEEVLRVQKKMLHLNSIADKYQNKFRQLDLSDDKFGQAYYELLSLLKNINGRLEGARILKEPDKPFVRTRITSPKGFDPNATFSREELYSE